MKNKRICRGYGNTEGKCKEEAGTPWTPHWCFECDKVRRETITKHLEALVAGFTSQIERRERMTAYPYVWRLKKWLPERTGQRCKVTAGAVRKAGKTC